ncbi:MAG: 16S rRNA (uracil(1498)-N(3))-methyltransferase [Proteobacteria bacterium]|nr:16S rRNA (uracil(1498)-N(3))-methyltransferase [Pseudomonadota bacterium]
MSTRLFVSGALSNDAELVLQGEQANYLGRTLRSRVGDTVTVFNGDGGEWPASIEHIGKNSVTLRLGAVVESATESPLKIHLVQGISRGERMDFVVQKATELGVSRITPILTHHGMIKLDQKRADKRRQHWQHIAESACEQSGRTQPPRIDEPVALNTWFGDRDPAGTMEIVLQATATASLVSLSAPTAGLCLLVGPEGGFSEREYEDAEIAGFQAASLGPRILRTETAALAAVTVAQSCWGDL